MKLSGFKENIVHHAVVKSNFHKILQHLKDVITKLAQNKLLKLFPKIIVLRKFDASIISVVTNNLVNTILVLDQLIAIIIFAYF